jgi:hypothetical protein
MRPPNECPPSQSGKAVRAAAAANASSIFAIATSGAALAGLDERKVEA